MEIFSFTIGWLCKMHGDADEASTKKSKKNIDPKNPFTINQLVKDLLFYLQVQLQILFFNNFTNIYKLFLWIYFN